MTLSPDLARLVAIASPALDLGPVVGVPRGPAGRELLELLSVRNGFYAFESALYVRSSGVRAEALSGWNSHEGWRQRYGALAEGLFFFAEDIFGGQFAIRSHQVVSFDPETGDLAVVGSSLNDWAARLLSDSDLLTGYPVAHEWQRIHGPLLRDQRLIPKTPFVLGGEYTLANLYPLDASTGMEVRADLAVQIRELPDGAQVNYRVID
jgi:hypothetical protein